MVGLSSGLHNVSVKVSSIIRPQTLHDLAHIALGGLQKKLKMIVQQDISIEAITK